MGRSLYIGGKQKTEKLYCFQCVTKKAVLPLQLPTSPSIMSLHTNTFTQCHLMLLLYHYIPTLLHSNTSWYYIIIYQQYDTVALNGIIISLYTNTIEEWHLMVLLYHYIPKLLHSSTLWYYYIIIYQHY